jgi:hypothetical protein
MAWTNSKIFRAYLHNSLTRTAALDLDADTLKAALYNNTGTPDQNIAAASSAYNTGQWVIANEVSQAGQWAAGGVALTSVVVDQATSAVVFLDAADTASGSAATLANVYGVLVYDDTLTTPVADQGISFNYLGGANSVTSGTLTVVWNANGIFRFTL